MCSIVGKPCGRFSKLASFFKIFSASAKKPKIKPGLLFQCWAVNFEIAWTLGVD